MPLPAGGNVPWPPEYCTPINAQYATWAAWYGGNVETLAHIYGGGGVNGDTTGFFASQTGGFKANVRRVATAVRRWFWGQPQIGTQQRTRLHVPIAGDIASASADMLFSEPPSFTIPTGPHVEGQAPAENPTQARLDELIDDGTQATLLEAAEVCAGLGGVYVRVVWDPKIRPDRPWLTAVHPDVAVPEWAMGKLTAVTFWRIIQTKGKIVVRHLERHEPGKIIHGVYVGDNDMLGQVVPLTDYPETAGLADARLIDGNTLMTGATRLCAVYVPNMRPNRIWRNNPDAVYLGRSDFAGVEALMDALDLTYSSWIRDVDLGKARLVVPREYMQSMGPGRGAAVDLDQEVYEPINVMAPEGGKVEVTQVQFKIRYVEHAATIAELKSTIVGAAGYSGQTFGLHEGQRETTATEVNSKDRRSLITRDRKTRYWRPELADIIETLLQVDVAQFGTAIVPQAPVVEFAPGVSVDPLVQAQTLAALDAAGAISTEMKVRTQHPDWDDPAIDEEVQRIHDENGVGMPADQAMAGYAGNTDPNATDPGNNAPSGG